LSEKSEYSLQEEREKEERATKIAEQPNFCSFILAIFTKVLFIYNVVVSLQRKNNHYFAKCRKKKNKKL